MQLTDGSLLAGRVRYAQPVDGYRTGIEPVLLAAAIPATPGQRVLEAGTGAGAALLCLGMRVPGLQGAGIERDPGMAALARRNMAANSLPFDILAADVSAAPEAGLADHVFANPPWHDPASTRPTGPRQDAAKHRGSSGLSPWVQALSAALKPRGTLTLILPAALAGEATALLHGAGLARLTLVPFWPRQGQPAKIILVQARRGTGPSRISPGLVLHGPSSSYTPAADAILRDGAALTL